MSNSAQAKLIAISSKDSWHKPSNSSSDSFARKMLHHPDPKEAAPLVGEQAGLEFDQKNGGEFARRTLDQVDYEATYKLSKKREAQLNEKLRNTPQHVKSYPDTNGGKPPKWRFYDKVSMFFLIIAIPVSMVMGASNLYTALISSGQPVFLEKPWLALTLSLIVPAGSAALKFISNFFEYPRTKKCYALSIYVLCAASLLTWTICFAVSFSGFSGEIDWENLGESNTGLNILLAWTQISTEILATAALFLAFEQLCFKYSPEAERDSIEYINAKASLDQHKKEHEALSKKRGENHGCLAEIKHEREAFINEAIADYLALRARFNAVSNF